MSLNERMIEVRIANNLTQEELAKKLGISKSKLSKYENGKAFPELDELQKFCKIFHITLEEMLDDKELKPRKSIQELYNFFAKGASIGFLSLFWTISAYFLIKFLDYSNLIALTFLIIGLLISIGIFINYGMQFEDINKKILKKERKYNKIEVKEAGKKNYPLIIMGFALIIVASIEHFALKPILVRELSITLFFGIFGIAIALIIYGGISMSRFDKQKTIKKQNAYIEKISAISMLIAIVIFLYMGISRNLWHPYWVAIPISGIICGLLNLFNK